MDRCIACGGKVVQQTITFDYRDGVDLVIVENVQAEVCTQCGESTLSPDVTDRLVRLVKGKLKPKRMAQVPVLDMASAR